MFILSDEGCGGIVDEDIEWCFVLDCVYYGVDCSFVVDVVCECCDFVVVLCMYFCGGCV